MRWNFDPALVAGLLVLAAFVRRQPNGCAALLVLIVAFVSPLCALSSALFSARVLHHVLLVAVAAPLLALALPRRGRQPTALALAVSTAVLWSWHLPAAYDLALANKGVYWAMQLTLLGSAFWFWRTVFGSARGTVEPVLFITAGYAQMGLLGALLTFAPAPLYDAHLLAPFEWNMTPLADQQLGGLVMWVPAGIPYAVAAAFLARRGWADLRRATA